MNFTHRKYNQDFPCGAFAQSWGASLSHALTPSLMGSWGSGKDATEYLMSDLSDLFGKPRRILFASIMSTVPYDLK